jgi:endonuclease G
MDPGLLPDAGPIVAQHGSYVSAYDQRLRNPAWACVRLEKRTRGANTDDAERADRSFSKFRPDSNIPEPFRTKPEDFRASGFDRGHLVAASDVAKQEDMDETFLMTNISPQVGAGMNRGFWQMLERFIRRLTYSYEDVFVCSGPLFLPEFDDSTAQWQVKYQLIGPRHDIAVPTHFFKCVHARTGERQSQTCFVVPNRRIDHVNEPLSKFVTPVDEVARLAGLQLFPEARRNKTNSVCDEVKCELIKEQILAIGEKGGK